MRQTSHVLDQRKWFAVGDVDDCWVVSAIQMVNVVAPWLYMVSAKEFRAGAGDPDDGNNDGGNVAEIVKGILACYPTFTGKITPLRKATYSGLTSRVDQGHVASVALICSKLPARLRHGFAGAHQVTLSRRNNDILAIADPLAPVYSRWDNCTWTEIRPAIMEYGLQRGGTASVYGVMGPTALEMLPTHPDFREAAAASAADLVNAAYRDGWNAAITSAAAITTDATARINALRRA